MSTTLHVGEDLEKILGLRKGSLKDKAAWKPGSS